MMIIKQLAGVRPGMFQVRPAAITMINLSLSEVPWLNLVPGKKLRLLLGLMLLSICGLAQQRPQYSLYYQNNYILNPAIAGIEDYYDAKLSYRNQWLGINGAPTTTYVSVQGPLGNIEKGHHGIGFDIIEDKTGPTSQLTIDASYAYHIPVTKTIKMAFGVSAGFTQYSLATDQLTLDQDFDPAVPRNRASQLVPDLIAGIWIYSEQFYLGASMTQLLPSQVNFNTQDKNPLNSLLPHEFVTAGYRFFMSDDFSITPSIMVKHVSPVPVSYDLNAKLQYRDIMWMGTSIRKTDGFSISAGFYISRSLNISYAYDYTYSPLQQYTSGSHEIILGLQLGNKTGVRCPKMNW